MIIQLLFLPGGLVDYCDKYELPAALTRFVYMYMLCILRCVPASVMGAEFLLEESHRPGLHTGPLLSPGGHGE